MYAAAHGDGRGEAPACAGARDRAGGRADHRGKRQRRIRLRHDAPGRACRHAGRGGGHALSGHGGAYYFLATYYMDGNVVQKNEQRAFEYYRRAAELGDEAGQAYLGMCYLDGTGTDKNEKAAFFWLSKCPDIDWSGLGLVKCYINGLGTSQNVNKGLKILMDIAKPHSSNVFVTEARTLARECANKGLPISAKFIAEIDAADKKESDLIDELIATFNEEDFN